MVVTAVSPTVLPALRTSCKSVTVIYTMTNAAAKAELPKYVGYAEIAEATGINKRQIQRLIERGKFPKPDALPTKGNRWRLSVVLQWLEQQNAEQIASLSDLAVTDPAKLKPEYLGDALQAVGSRLASLHGHEIAPDDVLGITYQLTEKQLAALAEEREQLLGDLIDSFVNGTPLPEKLKWLRRREAAKGPADGEALADDGVLSRSQR